MEAFVNDTVKLLLDTKTDVSIFSVVRIKYKKPNGVTGYWSAAACPSNNDYVQYMTEENDLDIAGTWKVQVYVSEDGEHYHGKEAVFKVYDPLL